MRPVLPLPKSDKDRTKKGKLQINNSHELKCKNSQQNVSKLNLAIPYKNE